MEEVLTLAEDDLIKITNIVTSANEDHWIDMEVQYKNLLEIVQVGIQELKMHESQIQVSVYQVSQISAQFTSAQSLDVVLLATGMLTFSESPYPPFMSTLDDAPNSAIHMI